MLKLLLLMVLLFVFMALVVGVSVLRTIRYMLFGKRQEKRGDKDGDKGVDSSEDSAGTGKKKIFGRNEGEYVDYEEVKD